MGRRRGLGAWALAASAFVAAAMAPAEAKAAKEEPVVIGWWSFFDGTRIPTNDAAHPIRFHGDPNTYFFEPSGARGMQADPGVIAKDVAWRTLVDYVLARSQSASLSPTFTGRAESDLNTFTQAYFGYALALLYVPEDGDCQDYAVRIGGVDDGVQAMVNGAIVGHARLGDANKDLPFFELGVTPPKTALRPGLNEVVLIHEDQAKVERYVANVVLLHGGKAVPLAPKNIVFGRVTDAATKAPLAGATLRLGASGGADAGAPLANPFVTGPLGFYFFAGTPDGSHGVRATARAHAEATKAASVAVGRAATEAVRVDFALEGGCSCPSGTTCGPNGGCLEACVKTGEFGRTCTDPSAVCVDGLCVLDACDVQSCATGFECRAGRCEEKACGGVCCAAGTTCRAGACVPDACGAGCPSGKTCSGGACVDACSLVTCNPGLTCAHGSCLEPCRADPASCVRKSVAVAGPGFAAPDAGPSSAKKGDAGARAEEDSDELAASGGCRSVPGDPRDGLPVTAGVLAAIVASLGARRRTRTP